MQLNRYPNSRPKSKMKPTSINLFVQAAREKASPFFVAVKKVIDDVRMDLHSHVPIRL